jgi:hypothetical protein
MPTHGRILAAIQPPVEREVRMWQRTYLLTCQRRPFRPIRFLCHHSSCNSTPEPALAQKAEIPPLLPVRPRISVSLPSQHIQDLASPPIPPLTLLTFGSVVAAGICRTIYMDRVINRTYDTTWALYIMWMWTLIENYLAICCASAPALKPLYVRYIAPPLTSAIGYVIRSPKNSHYTGDSYTHGSQSETSKFGLTSTASSRSMAKRGIMNVRELSRYGAEKDVERLGLDLEAGKIMVRNEILFDVEEASHKGQDINDFDQDDRDPRNHWTPKKERKRRNSSGHTHTSDSIEFGVGIAEERHPGWMLPVPAEEVAWGINGRVCGGGLGMGRAI